MDIFKTPLQQGRYRVEHYAIPSILFTGGLQEFIETSEKYNIMHIMFDNALRDLGEPSPYQSSDFTTYNPFDKDGCTIYAFKCPKPIVPTNCFYVYVIVNNTTDKIFYFTVELTELGNIILGRWTEKQEHINYGPINKDENIVEKCMGIIKDES